ncbi:MAG: hypothetical protein ACOCSD_04810 [Halolamina sp.]
MYEPPLVGVVSERSTSVFDFGERLAPIRTGRFADAATALAWIAGAAATVVHPAGLAVAGLLLGVVATSVSRAVASGASFGIALVSVSVVWLAVTGTAPPTTGLGLFEATAAAVLAPATVAATVRVLG